MRRLREAPTLLRRLCLATLAANIVIVVTGGAVRLTSSGLGCPTWPRCTEGHYVATAENGLHGYIEFGNRMLTFALVAIVAATFLTAWLRRPRRRSIVLLAAAQVAGIPGQAVMGGVTVLTHLNPWAVAAHFLFSMLLIFGAYALYHRSGETDARPAPIVPAAMRWLLRGIVLFTVAVITLGTVVTGSGPHSGDRGAKRTGFDPGVVSQLHADVVFVLIGLSLGAWFALRAMRAPARLRTAVSVMIAVQLGQGIIGFTQYTTHLPIALVGAHLFGASILWAVTVAVLFRSRTREPAAA
jgi:cytochrome c oxidase assembly protein subunit 15